MIQGILFDKDGTLLDFAATWVPVFHEAAKAVVHDHEGDHQDSLVRKLLSRGGYEEASGQVKGGSLLAQASNAEIAEDWAEALPKGDPDRLNDLLDDIFADHGANHSVPVTDLAGLFQRLRGRGLKLGVATSDSLRGAKASLEPFAVLELLDFVAGFDSGHGTKPGPGMVQAFCRESNLPPEQVAVVGDNLHDLEMGRSARAGLLVGVLTGTSGHEDLAPYADHVLGSIEDLEALLDSLAA